MPKATRQHRPAQPLVLTDIDPGHLRHDILQDVHLIGHLYWGNHIVNGTRYWDVPERSRYTATPSLLHHVSNARCIAAVGVRAQMPGIACPRCHRTPWEPTARGRVDAYDREGAPATGCRHCTPQMANGIKKYSDPDLLAVHFKEAREHLAAREDQQAQDAARQRLLDARRNAASPIPYLDATDPVDLQVSAILDGIYAPGENLFTDHYPDGNVTYWLEPVHDPLSRYLQHLSSRPHTFHVDVRALAQHLRAVALQSRSPRLAETVTVFVSTLYAMRQAGADSLCALISACATLRRATHIDLSAAVVDVTGTDPADPAPTNGPLTIAAHEEQDGADAEEPRNCGDYVLVLVQQFVADPEVPPPGYRHNFVVTVD